MESNILNWCQDLSKSQGLYGRLYEQLLEDPDALHELETQGFKDITDFILFIEGL